MIVIHELQEPIPVEVKHLGKGLAILIECGTNDYKWTIIFESRAIVTVPQNKVWVQKDFSNNRGISARALHGIIERVRDGFVTEGVQSPAERIGRRVYEKRRGKIRKVYDKASRHDQGRQGRRHKAANG